MNLSRFTMLVLYGCQRFTDSDRLRLLTDQDCKPYVQAAFKPTLGADWQAYLAATRICSLTQKPDDEAKIVLATVFINDFYSDKVADTRWEQFPKPTFFDRQNRCLARLPDPYPAESPRDLEIRYGHWRDGIPQQIPTHVLNPAVDGDYALPRLKWDAQTQRFVPDSKSTTDNAVKLMRC